MPRAIGREMAVKTLYAKACGGEGTPRELWMMTAAEDQKVDRREFRQAAKLVEAVEAKQAQLDEDIQAHLKNWSVSRLDLLDWCVLRVAAYELRYSDVPHAVSIKEALAFADEYGGEKSPGFINGVLGALSRALEAAEPQLEA